MKGRPLRPPTTFWLHSRGLKNSRVNRSLKESFPLFPEFNVVRGFKGFPLKYTKDNVLGTHNLLEICRLYCPDLEKFIHVSTDEVYGESMLLEDETCKTEQAVLCPTNPYAASKAAAEMLVQSYNHSFNIPIIITRGNNVYGPLQYDEKVIPRFIGQLKRGKRVTIQGDGSCVRAFYIQKIQLMHL